MPFGLPSGNSIRPNNGFNMSLAPSVYQGLNSAITSLMRQYGVPNFLYIGYFQLI